MAKPRTFISSTHYDLKHIRAAFELFVDSLGFDAVLSEKGDIAYTHDRPLDESCYREVENADIFVLIVGGRYGSEVSSGSKKPLKSFFERYDSITKKEYQAAADRDIPIYILIEKGVYSEYQTYSRNKEIENIKYAHVDSVNVFLLIEDILARPRNNPVQTFERFEEIESWLREQWAGLFRELLRRQSQQQQLVGLSQQVLELKESNQTLKTYLEAVMRGVGKQETSKLIESEEKRLEEVRKLDILRPNLWVSYVTRRAGVDIEQAATALRKATSFASFATELSKFATVANMEEQILRTLSSSTEARRDLNRARELLGLTPLDPTAEGFDPAHDEPGPRTEESEALRRLRKLRAARSVASLIETQGNSEVSTTNSPGEPAATEPATPKKRVARKKAA